jgi:hypothetical protein
MDMAKKRNRGKVIILFFFICTTSEHLADVLSIIERNEKIVKDKTKKRSITFP